MKKGLFLVLITPLYQALMEDIDASVYASWAFYNCHPVGGNDVGDGGNRRGRHKKFINKTIGKVD